jgi:hypothetical protein
VDSQRAERGHDFVPPDEALRKMPGAYGSENVPAADKTIWLHYFSAASDHYLAEVWHEPGEEGEPGQWMGFGYARLAAFPEGAEWGYINLDELEQLRAETPDGLPLIVERDLNWEPTKFSQIGQAHKEPGDTGRNLTLDQHQAATIIAALEDAAALRREAIGYCPDCKQSPAGPCPDHGGSWETADEYDNLRWQLEADAGYPGDPRRDEPKREEYESPEVPDAAQAIAPEVANTIGDHARAENRPEFGPDEERYVPEAEAEAQGRRRPSAAYAEWPSEGQVGLGSTERQLGRWNEHDAQVNSLEADQREAGE